MAYRSFEDLDVWKRACRLSVEIFETFRPCGYSNLTSQIERSGLSVPSNIAEGAERGGSREYSQFLKIAKGSAGELRTQLYIARKLKAIPAEAAAKMISECSEISAMIEGLRKSLLRNKTTPPKNA
jgi:four helix bundle protein